MDTKYLDEGMKLCEIFLQNIKTALPKLRKLLEEHSSHWTYEDGIYRFYHQSFKVYALQSRTQEIVQALQNVAPAGVTIHRYFEAIFMEGATGKQFEYSHNKEWLQHTRPMVEAFFHAKFFLEMAVKYGEELESAPNIMPSGWAALLYLFNLR